MSARTVKLRRIREIQGITGPNYCLGSAKFFVGKVAGLFHPDKTWNDFMNSPWAKRHSSGSLIAAWGLFKGSSFFNKTVLPAAMREPSAGVKPVNPPPVKRAEFHTFRDSVQADLFLRTGVPIVVGVDFPGGKSTRDHFISAVRLGPGWFYLVDSWEAMGRPIYRLSQQFSFSDPKTIEMSSGTMMVPCTPTWYGYYRDADGKTAISNAITM